ncbi:type I polyketide synthase [Amycolatopsis sp. NPDC005232]|uniref:type I polyketide synthase n=1 Tax=Amycolatopsis sp. NPDC005232 TaxID=3157027 RepID=UPI0033A24DA7
MHENAVAVIGFAGRFPGAADVGTFWDNLCAGRNSVSRFSPAELAAAGVGPEVYTDLDYVPVRGIVEGIEDFDAELFGMTPREAELTDPQQRVLLECARTALETAGYAPGSADVRVGVFAGASPPTYLRAAATVPAAQLGDTAVAIGNDSTFLATRLAYKLDLRGPAITVQTACSTSLVAVHLACQSLLCGEADLALASGVSITVPQTSGQRHTPNGIISPDGHCRSFDADARGTVAGNGAAVVVLKRAEAALADGDTIYAVIRGSAVNNDGAAKVGFTAPGVEGQAEVVAMAQHVAGVSPDEISYLEAHGTGTELGDPIEVAALTEAFRRGTDRIGFCALGSVKPNIGHLDAAAGVAGLLKCVLALYHERIPPTAGFARPNPLIPFEESPFFVTTEPRDWPRVAGVPRRCGVSSFGIGGTNAHLVLEEAPTAARVAGPGRAVVIPLSARTPVALATLIERTSEALATADDLAAAAYTLQTGRTGFAHRAAVVAAPGDAAADLNKRFTAAARVAGAARHVIFLFPGQGALRPGMLRELYDRHPAVRAAVDRCADVARPLLDDDVRDVLCAGARAGAAAQPALFTLGYALAELLGGWGIRPDVVLGHSLGEYVAACVAGALPVEDALRLVVRRGQAMTRTPPGAMLVVDADEAEVRSYLRGEIWICGVNAPSSVTVAGAPAAVRELVGVLTREGIGHVWVEVDRAFHTPLVEPALASLRAAAAEVDWQPLTVPLAANHTGTLLPTGTVLSPEHWVTHAREPVRLREAATSVLGLPDAIFLELGGGHALTTAVRENAAGRKVPAFSLAGRDGVPDEHDVLTAVAGFWSAGGSPQWTVLSSGPRRRVPLPTYPYDRRRHWFETAAGPPSGSPSEVAAAEDAGTGIVAEVERIWVELLGHERFDPDASFLDLGGNSLTAVQLLTRLRTAFGVRLSLRLLFDSPTVAGIAELVRTAVPTEGPVR